MRKEKWSRPNLTIDNACSCTISLSKRTQGGIGKRGDLYTMVPTIRFNIFDMIRGIASLWYFLLGCLLPPIAICATLVRHWQIDFDFRLSFCFYVFDGCHSAINQLHSFMASVLYSYLCLPHQKYFIRLRAFIMSIYVRFLSLSNCCQIILTDIDSDRTHVSMHLPLSPLLVSLHLPYTFIVRGIHSLLCADSIVCLRGNDDGHSPHEKVITCILRSCDMINYVDRDNRPCIVLHDHLTQMFHSLDLSAEYVEHRWFSVAPSIFFLHCALICICMHACMHAHINCRIHVLVYRDIYYMLKPHIPSQHKSDRYIGILCSVLQCSRLNLHVVGLYLFMHIYEYSHCMQTYIYIYALMQTA